MKPNYKAGRNWAYLLLIVGGGLLVLKLIVYMSGEWEGSDLFQLAAAIFFIVLGISVLNKATKS